MRILLKNAETITINENCDLQSNCCIGISGTTIDYVGDYRADLEDSYNTVINCKGKAVMPGFVNAHNHASMTMLRNYADDMKLMDWLFNKIFPIEDKFSAESVYAATNLAILEMIKSGTTTFCDMYFFMNTVAECVGISGIRAVLGRGLQGETDELDIDYRLKEGLDLYNSYNDGFGGRVKVNLAPHSVYTCSVPYLKKVSNKAKECGIPIQIHLSESKEEVRTCIEKHGMSPVKLLDSIGMLNDKTIAAHCVALDEEDIAILKKHNVNVVHNPKSNLKLASGIAPVSRLLAEGINVCLGTDGASSNNNLNMLEEVRMATYLQKVLTDDPTSLPVDMVLKMGTVNGAKALGIEDIGKIKEGMKADLIIFDTEKASYYPKYNIKSAIVYSGSSADIETVIIDGRIIMKDREVLTMDEERILFEAQEWAEKLTK